MGYLDTLNRHHLHLGWLSVIAALLEDRPLGAKELGRELYDLATWDDAQDGWFEEAEIEALSDGKVSFASAPHIVDMAAVYGIYDPQAELLTELGHVLLAVEPWRPGDKGSPFRWGKAKRFVGLYLLFATYGSALAYILQHWPSDNASGVKEVYGTVRSSLMIDVHSASLYVHCYPLLIPLRDLGYVKYQFSIDPDSWDYFILYEKGKRLALTLKQHEGTIGPSYFDELPRDFLFTEGIKHPTPAPTDALLATCNNLPLGLQRPEVSLEAVALLAQAQLLAQGSEHFLNLRRAIELMPAVHRASGGRFTLLETGDDPLNFLLKTDAQSVGQGQGVIDPISSTASSTEAEALEPTEAPAHDGDEVEDNLEGDRVDAPAEKPPSWSVQIIKAERSIFELHRRWAAGAGALVLKPDFQREFVWDLPKQVKLIESVLARIPLPVVYLSDESEEETLVIDGQQRLTTLFRYMDNHFALRNLRLLPHLNGKRFRDLDARLQRRFEDTPITAYVIQPGSNPEVKFEVFERLNQGAVDLNAQEIRNSLFRGAGLEMLKDLGHPGGLFRAVAGPHRRFARMKADELILRAIAFLDCDYKSYRGDMKQFLNEELQHLNQMSGEERASVRERFERSLEITRRVFGDKAFRRYQPRAKAHYSPELNAALMDVVVWGFSRYDSQPDFWAERSAAVIAMAERLQESGDFHDAISSGTGDTGRVETRFTLWQNGLDNVLRDHP